MAEPPSALNGRVLDPSPVASWTEGRLAVQSWLGVAGLGVDHHLLVLQGNTPTARFAPLALGAVELSRGYRVAIQVHTLGREHVELHRAYHVGEAMVVLVRPDGHIGYQGPLADLPGLRDYLDCWYAAMPESGSDSIAS